MPRALITGVAGQTGSYLAEQLLADGWQVDAAVRVPEDLPAELRSIGLRLHTADFAVPGSAAALLDASEPDAVFNLAAISSVAESWHDPVGVAQINALAVAELLAAVDTAVQRTGRSIGFVQASSAEIFGNADETPQNERTRIAPINPYGASKAYAHHLVGVYRAKGLAASSCVLYNHESPRRPVGFVTRKITASVAGIATGSLQQLTLGNLDAVRDWGWAPEYATALRLAADRPGDYVIATGQAHTVADFVGAAFAAAGIDDWSDYVRVDPSFIRPTDPPLLVGDPSRARADLDWSASVGFEDIVSRMVAADLALAERGELPSIE